MEGLRLARRCRPRSSILGHLRVVLLDRQSTDRAYLYGVLAVLSRQLPSSEGRTVAGVVRGPTQPSDVRSDTNAKVPHRGSLSVLLEGRVACSQLGLAR